jgi:predicted nucleic acid-binding protein
LADYVCNTSPLQYLHQVGLLDLLGILLGDVLVPPAVVDELAVGRSLGVDLPDLDALTWVVVQAPSGLASLPTSPPIGPGESEVIALALERGDAVVVLDDRTARSVALSLGLRLTGTLGLLLDAKRAGLLAAVEPMLDRLQACGFRLAPATSVAVLRRAGELP